MTRFAALGAVLCVVSGFAPAATAAPSATLTIAAPKSAAMNVRLSRAVTFHLGEPGDDGPVVRIKGGGELAGFLLIPTRREAVGQVALRRDGADTTYFTAGDPVVTLPAGTYRLHVTASSPVTITVPVAGLSRTTWRPSEPLVTSRTAATWDLPAGPLLTGTARVSLRSRSVGLFVLDHHATGQGHSDVVCLTRTTDPCGQGDSWQSRTDVVVIGVQVDRPAGFAVLADRPAAPGTYTARWQVAANGVASQPTATVYVIG